MKNAFWYIVAAAALALAFLLQSPYMAYGVYAFLLLLAVAHHGDRALDRALRAATARAANTGGSA